MQYVEIHPNTGNARNNSNKPEPQTQRHSAADKNRLKAAALEHLRAVLNPGDTVCCILRKVSRSGMARQIDFFIVGDDRRPHRITGYIADALDYPLNHNCGALKVSGCGMDMGFEIVYNLGRALWPNGTPKPHGRRNGEPDSDGGYALKHSWL